MERLNLMIVLNGYLKFKIILLVLYVGK